MNKIDLSTEFAQTPKKNGRPSEDKAPLLRKLSNAPLPLEQVYSKEKLLSRDEAEITFVYILKTSSSLRLELQPKPQQRNHGINFGKRK